MRIYLRRCCLGLLTAVVVVVLVSFTSSLYSGTDVVSHREWAEHPVAAQASQVVSANVSRAQHTEAHSSPAHSPAAPHRAYSVWPGRAEKYDRIVEQLDASSRSAQFAGVKTILAYSGLPRGTVKGDAFFVRNDCAVKNCVLTSERSALETADAVVFQGAHFPNRKYKHAHQAWAWFQLESPLHSRGLSGYEGLFNWTATYRRDSTIVAPYEKFVHFKNYTTLPEKAPRNYAAGKTKKVAWFVSNCGANNGRLRYAQELGRHIDVDIFGPCGKKKCPRSQAKKCFEMLNKDYKFYLAFENSNCRDYITEKFYWNGLWNDVLPVVLGAAPGDYEAVAPPHSYIHVDDFDSPASLAQYLHKLDADDALYNEYFRWKGTGEFINTKFYCRVCRMVHEAAAGRRTWYADPNEWWRGSSVCLGAAHKTPLGYISWRGQLDQDTFENRIQAQLKDDAS